MEDAGLVILSNRLPLKFEPDGERKWKALPSDGGLVSALDPVLRRRGGVWVGWPGSTVTLPAVSLEEAVGGRPGGTPDFRLRAVHLTAEEASAFYQRACNETLWPLLHGMPERSRPCTDEGAVYERINQRFAVAAATAASAAQSRTVWVHDYHLLGAGSVLRRLLPRARLGLFLHTPFPEAEVMLRLPWARDLLPSLASFDLIGFQTERDRRNFHSWAEALSRPDRDPCLSGDERLRKRTGTFPISVDWGGFHGGAGRAAVRARSEGIREELRGRILLLGVDRLDYTKGIPERLGAYEALLERRTDLHERVQLVQLAVPSRTDIAEYEGTRRLAEATAARINARFGRGGWAPVRYVYGTWPRDELLAWYAAADVCVVTPARDGMNLVAKEFVAASRSDGVLVLSRGAGASAELAPGAVLVESAEAEGVATALEHAIRMPRDERRRRLALMQERVRGNDVHRWARDFLDALASRSGSHGRPGPRAPAASRRHLRAAARRPEVRP